VATMVIAKWNGALDIERARRILDGHEDADRTDARDVISATAPVAAND
jgi:hypothetical protein